MKDQSDLANSGAQGRDNRYPGGAGCDESPLMTHATHVTRAKTGDDLACSSGGLITMTHSDVFVRVYKGIFPVWKSVVTYGR